MPKPQKAFGTLSENGMTRLTGQMFALGRSFKEKLRRTQFLRDRREGSKTEGLRLHSPNFTLSQ
jgi:hypothetical protein